MLLAIALEQAPPSTSAILTEVRALLEQPQTPERMARIEAGLLAVSDREDRYPDLPTLATRLPMHIEMLERYRAAGDRAGVRRHARFLMAAERWVDPTDWAALPDARPRASNRTSVDERRAIRARHATAFVTGRIDFANAVLADGDRAKAIWWLETGERLLADIPGAVKALRAERDRIRQGGPPRLGGG
jgi:hypothetical protein